MKKTKHMTYRSTTFVSLLAVFGLLTITACDVLDTGEENVHEVLLNFQATETAVEAGGNSIEVNEIKLHLEDFVFTSPEFDQERDTVVVDSTTFPDHFPRVVTIAADQSTKVNLGQLELGDYGSAGLTITPPSGQEVSDSELGTDFSFLVNGTYNGNSFTLKLETDSAATESIFPQSLLMNKQTATVNLDFKLKTETMFKRSSSRLWNPNRDTVAELLSKELYRYIKLEEGTRTLRKYEDMR